MSNIYIICEWVKRLYLFFFFQVDDVGRPTRSTLPSDSVNFSNVVNAFWASSGVQPKAFLNFALKFFIFNDNHNLYKSVPGYTNIQIKFIIV